MPLRPRCVSPQPAPADVPKPSVCRFALGERSGAARRRRRTTPPSLTPTMCALSRARPLPSSFATTMAPLTTSVRGLASVLSRAGCCPFGERGKIARTQSPSTFPLTTPMTAAPFPCSSQDTRSLVLRPQHSIGASSHRVLLPFHRIPQPHTTPSP